MTRRGWGAAMAAGGPVAALIGLVLNAYGGECPALDSSCTQSIPEQNFGLLLMLAGAVAMVVGIVILATTPKTGVQAPGGPTRTYGAWSAPGADPLQTLPAGWYPSPGRPGMLRWWDGSTWGPEAPIPPPGKPGGFGSSQAPAPDESPPGPPQ